MISAFDNQRANSVQANANKTHPNAPKRQQNSWRLRALIFVNPDFSMGYGRKNKQKLSSFPARPAGCDRMLQTAAASPSPLGCGQARIDSANGNMYSAYF